jgi:phage terminase large subunit-like protein
MLINQEDPAINAYDYASIHLFPYLVLHNLNVDPVYKYSNKFFLSLCDYFNDFLENEDKRLLILEAAPRSGKTEFILNIVIPFIAGNNPSKRMMLITSTRQTRKKLRKALERIFNTDFFKDLFQCHGRVRCNESNITLPNGFEIFLTTTLSTVPTGDGFHFIVATDYIAANMIDSKATMESAMTNWHGYMTRKQNNPATKVIIDNQRLSFYDLSWKVTSESDRNGEIYTRITFPFQFNQACSVKLPCGLLMPFKKDEYLTERFNDREKRAILSTTSEEVYQIQYLQNPSMDKGKIFSRAYFRFYNSEDLDNLDINRIFITTDFAFTQKEESDYTVFCCWAEDLDNNLLLLDMQRGKYKGIQLNTMMYNFWHKWQNGIGNVPCSFITIEKAGQQNITLVDSMRNGFYIDDDGQTTQGKEGKKVFFNCGIRQLPRGGSLGKYTRVMQNLAYIQQGKVYLPSFNVQINGVDDIVKEIVDPFILEHEQFSQKQSVQRKQHDDIVDNCIDAVSIVNKARADYATEVSSL